jgi:hypothetical protein
MNDSLPRPPSQNATPSPARSRGPVLTVVGILAVVGLVAGAVRWRQPSTPPAERGPQPTAVPPVAVAPQPQVETGRTPPPRAALESLSSDPEYARWLLVGGLVDRIASAVAIVAEGDSPREPLSFLAPKGAFMVDERARGTFITSASYARYDGVARVFSSLDAEALGRVYLTLRPALSAVYATLSPPGARFDQALQRATQRMLEVPRVRGEVEVVPRGAVWAYKDASLEALTPAQKHLLRMGPKNVARIQDKLRELSNALELKLARR